LLPILKPAWNQMYVCVFWAKHTDFTRFAPIYTVQFTFALAILFALSVVGKVSGKNRASNNEVICREWLYVHDRLPFNYNTLNHDHIRVWFDLIHTRNMQLFASLTDTLHWKALTGKRRQRAAYWYC
jgi:hypothetical protein